MPKMKSTEVRERACKKELDFDLTREEREAKLEQSLSLEKEIDKVKTEISDFRKSKNAEVKQMAVERTRLRRHIEDNREARVVDCKEVFDFKSDTVRYVFKGKVKLERKMYDHERQEELPLSGTTKKKARTKSEQIRDVAREETSAKTKSDMSTGPEAQAQA